MIVLRQSLRFLVLVAALHVTATTVAAEEKVISLGFDAYDGEPHPPTTTPDDEIRFGSAFATLPSGEGALLYGGRLDEDGLAEDDTWLWDGSSWTPACGAPGAPEACGPGSRSFAGIATLPDGVLLYGGTNTGIDEAGATFSDAFLWHDGAWEKICTGCAPGARVSPAMAGHGGAVLLFGGFDRNAPPANDTWLFDGTDWTEVHPGGGDAPIARVGAHLAWDGTRFVLFGGARIPGPNDPDIPVVLDDTWAFEEGAWTLLCGGGAAPCGPAGRFVGGFAHLPSPDPEREGALLAGGMKLLPEAGGDPNDPHANFPEFLDDIWFWNQEAWIRLGSPWVGGAFADDEDDEEECCPGPGDEDDDVPMLFPEFPVFPVMASDPARCGVTLVAAFTGGLLPEPLGSGDPDRTWSIGFDLDRDGTPDACPEDDVPRRVVGVAFEEREEPGGPDFAHPADDFVFRFFPGFAGLPDGESALLYGGMFLDGDDDAAPQAESDTWLWSDGEWTPLCGSDVPGATADCGPGPRVLHGMAQGPEGVVLYGGSPAAGPGVGLEGARDDAFVWSDAEGWVPLCDGCPPGARLGAAMAGNGESILLFGGAVSEDELAGDTWLWADGTWTLVDPGSEDGPEPRLGAQLAWDGTRYVLIGGLAMEDDGEIGRLVEPDTWVWDGAGWELACAAEDCGPAPRAAGAFAHLASPDPELEGALLVGGFLFGEDFNPLGDTWLWDGTRWIKLGGPFVDRILSDLQSIFTVPAFGVAAARPADCQVLLAGLLPVGDSFDDADPEERTWSVGFDADRDGRPDPCPEPTPEPTPVPTPGAPTPAPGATPTPAPEATPTPDVDDPVGARVPIGRGARRVPRALR